MGQRRTEVLHAAIELLDEVGLDALTMRLLASRLGVRASALYRHYPSKQALLDAMVAHLVGTGELPEAEWDELLRGAASGLRSVMLAHRDGARLIAGFHDPGPDAVAAFERLITALTEAGVPAAAVAVDTVMAYANGFTVEEQARKTRWPREGRDRAFDDGLALIIAGIRASMV
ncbi:TetR/AcrR family transcriptional regulator C-terminal domain-containing protein [Amycolatopsis sp. OK19-0408]|uniref:TetR/AcrR family transcriptional regulator C-terminal domain-containing protein n=1 Tax=Amycolatopsis iheyensis TaxID=2945988 RepID=A0A9X2SNT6_9PSEU|nr:TetR/AcrR family transcriptional regulator C-terminal domain-containing protein [Amycolatopsis iheyensis]MCR6487436.1 TetR/AcrR family transcriptional regulator C-terminal domain-containing protein [Amycolatopsis iheyensis]